MAETERRAGMKLVKAEKEEKKYFVPEIAQAVGLSEGTIHGFFKNSGRKRSTKDGLTIDEIDDVLQRKRTRGDGIDFEAVAEIRRRLIHEKGYTLINDEESAEMKGVQE